MISQKISLSLVLLILLFLFLIIIILKYYQFCNFFSDCSLTQMEYGGDLGKYKIKYYLSVLILLGNDLNTSIPCLDWHSSIVFLYIF